MSRKRKSWRGSLATVAILLVLMLTSVVVAQVQRDRFENRGEPAMFEALKLSTPATVENVSFATFDRRQFAAEGRQSVIVRLKSASVANATAVAANERSRHRDQLEDEQRGFIDRCMQADSGIRVLAQTQLVLNAVFLEVDVDMLADIARDRDVLAVRPVADYELYLSETVPYIGASAVQDAGFTGDGISIAVLDSGIDYTHANFGGPGTLAAYNAAYGNFTSRDGLFPTAKVVEGFDFVGETWPFGPLAPDEDPIDLEGHGTHVADISGGLGGVAPDADLYAVKVCSAVSSSCSGVALIQGMEYSVDPDGDGDTSDKVDIINMSLGSNYGQPFDDDLAAAVDAATALGVLTVAAAGNGGNRPYVHATPASAESALAVAQTQVPSAELQLLTVNGVDYPAVFQPWSAPPATLIEGETQYGDGAGGNLNGCAAFADPSKIAGKVVLVDRGACNFTLKIKNIGDAGGVVGIIGLVTPGAPFAGGDGGDRPIDIPGYMVSQADADAIKAAAAVGATGSVDPGNTLSLVSQMVGSSSRGPQHENTTLIKPEIGAPGASISAIAGTGSGVGPFGGTSGASPMVAGSAALLLQAAPGLTPAEVKARLMNTGETDIKTDPFSDLAPIARIGGGEVRVDRAVASPGAAWDARDPNAVALSFGFDDVSRKKEWHIKWVRVRNYTFDNLVYNITPTFRYEDDETNGAVEINTFSRILVRPRRDTIFPVFMKIHGKKLRGNFMSSGVMGADPSGITTNEYDGYLILEGDDHSIHLPWHVLPRQAARVRPFPRRLHFNNQLAEVKLRNLGVGTAQNDAYSLIAVSDEIPEGGRGEQMPTPDLRAVGVNTIPVPAGFCSGQESFLWTFAINTWERQEHLVPVIHNVYMDTDQDGIEDFVVFNFDLSFSGTIADGRQATWAFDLSTGSATAFFLTEHAMNTGNTVLVICGEQVGLNGLDLLRTPVDIRVEAQDWYYGGPGDEIDGLTVTPLGERYVGFNVDDVPGRDRGMMEVFDFLPFPNNTPELGNLLFTNGDRGPGARGGATKHTEAILLKAAGGGFGHGPTP